MPDIDAYSQSGADLIAAERQRQIDVEGRTPEHDARHDEGDLLHAAVCYVEAGHRVTQGWGLHPRPPIGLWVWPWDHIDWKPDPDDPIRNLVKAGALIAAEIDRLAAVTGPTEGADRG